MHKIIKNIRISLSILALAVLGIVAIWQPLAFAFIFLFYPFVFFASKDLVKSTLLFVYNFFFNLTLIITVPLLLSLFEVPINLYSALAVLLFTNLFILLRINYVIETVGLLLKPVGKVSRNFGLTLFLIVASVFVVGVVNYLPASNELAPLTHDPQAHAYYTKTIEETGSINYFYSPGLHIFCLFVSSAFGISIALSVHYVSYFVIGLMALGIGVFLLWATQRRALALVATGVFLSAPSPWLLPPIAGKNALIFAGAYLTFLMFSLYVAYRYKKPGFYIVFTIALITLGFIHYPTFPYGLILSALLLTLIAIVTKCVDRQKINWTEIKILAGGLVVSLAAVYSWVKYHQSVFTELARVDRSGEVVPSRSIATFDNVSADILSASLNVANTYASNLSSHSPLFLYAFVASLPILIIGLAAKKYFWISLSAFSVIITMVFIPIIVNLVAPSSLKIIASGGPLLVYIPLSVVVGCSTYIFLDILKKSHILWKSVSLILAFSLIFSIYYFMDSRFKRMDSINSRSSSVTKHDLAAFGWINSRPLSGEKFIVDAYAKKTRTNAIFSQYGGLWIPVYTDSKISMPFEMHMFLSKLSNDNYALYSQVKNEDKEARKALEELVNKGYGYYYENKWLGESKTLDIQFVDALDDTKVTKLYENKQVAIYRIDVK